MQSRNRSSPGERVVRHRLADGTVKEYRYQRGKPKPKTPAADSLAAMIRAWRISPEWAGLAASTKSHYSTYVEPFEEMGEAAAVSVTRRDVLGIRDAIAAARGNGAATAFIRAASSLFAWGVDREWVTHSPVNRIKPLPGGHLQAWTAPQADHAEAALPQHLSRVVTLARYTGQRRGDLCAMGWSAYDGSTIRLIQQKTGTPLVVPVHPLLKARLDQWERTATTILTDFKDRPWKPVSLSKAMPPALARIGIDASINIHGLRKLAATMLAEAGCSVHEIAAVTGHQSLGMVELYTRSADQERLAGAAIVKFSTAKAGR